MEALKTIARRLREMYEFGRSESFDIEVSITNDDYEVDLGSFGYQSMTVEVEDSYYSLDAEEILNRYPLTTSDFEELADELDELVASMEGAPGEAVPASNLVFEQTLLEVEKTTGTSFVQNLRNAIANYLAAAKAGPLPPQPQPWPGACRPDIDYTADDFPRRYKPPWGFTWVASFGSSDAAPPESAARVDASAAKEQRKMVMDKLGRVKWMELDELDTYDSGGFRWCVWHNSLDGIPEANSFGAGYPPRAIAADGSIIPIKTEKKFDERFFAPGFNFEGRDLESVKALIASVREAGDPNAAMFVMSASGVSYDPRTVALSDSTLSGVKDEDLRLGDNLEGYGRVLKVERRTDGVEGFRIEYAPEYNLQETQVEQRKPYEWFIRPIAGVDRDSQPTAFSLSGGAGGNGLNEYGVNYDPLTVELATSTFGTRVPTKQLRVGDDITGPNWGRVLSIKRGPSQKELILVLSRNDDRRERVVAEDSTWATKVITGVNRDAQPTAFSLLEARERGELAAPALSFPIVDAQVAYDPLTIEVGSVVTSQTDQLRIGDDIVGDDYGRVVAVAKSGDAFTLSLNRNGQINTVTAEPDEQWSVLPIIGRESYPPASGAQAAQPSSSYDPLTVPVDPASIYDNFENLRIGDDVTGTSFGRIVEIKSFADGVYTVLVNRDGTEREKRWQKSTYLNVLPIKPPQGRETVPTAISVFEGDGAPPTSTVTTGTADDGYDPLTVPVKSEKQTIQDTELRLGDDILGGSFGRVVGIENGKLVLDRDGRRTTIDVVDGGKWEVYPIDLPNREEFLPAIKLGTAPPPVAVAF